MRNTQTSTFLPKDRKYHNQRVIYAGQRFDSKLEMHRYLFLLDEERQGRIKNLQCQVSFELFPQWRDKVTQKVYKRTTTYVADFTYEKDGRLIVEDTKGMETPVFKLKEIAMHFLLGIDIRKIKRATESI